MHTSLESLPDQQVVGTALPGPGAGAPPSQRGGARRSTARRLAGRGVSIVLYTAIIVLVAALLGVLAGYRVSVVRSGSMTPTLDVGALIVNRAVSPLDVHPGEIVTFHSRTLDASVTHRVVSVRRDGDEVQFVTKGDANHTTESWQVPVGSKVGRTVAHLNGAGRWLATLTSRWLRVLAIILAAAMLLTFLLRAALRSTEPAE